MAQEPKSHPGTPGDHRETEAPSGPTGVMIVDDEAPICSMVAEILSSAGYKVWEANSGARALEVWASHRQEIGLILLDVVMPGMDGLTLLSALRRQKPNADIVLVSGRLDEDTRWLASESGCHYLPKPFEVSDLVRLTRDLLGPATPPASR
ncbi:MAG TPA: response regulator [Opitutaceae bacterium]|nr:response regulator [Opitutaceae bacterium]HRE07515.1 response regulator [Opitutaceae bacterium]